MKYPIVFPTLIGSLTSALLVVAGMAAQPLVELRACKLIPTEWADGDSFEVQTADGTRQTVRLYGTDCIEWHVTDETDARRLREQRRYFGIAEFGGSPQASIDASKATGQKAAEETARALGRPFTVHTSFADARGDGKHKRIYGFESSGYRRNHGQPDHRRTPLQKGFRSTQCGRHRPENLGTTGSLFVIA